MNSFRFIERGIQAEIERQSALLEAGGQVVQETLHFDPASGAISSLRSKEEAHDYRYFPEPDLLPVAIDEAMIAAGARGDAASCRPTRAERLERELGLSAERAQLLAFRGELGDFFEAALASGADPAPARAGARQLGRRRACRRAWPTAGPGGLARAAGGARCARRAGRRKRRERRRGAPGARPARGRRGGDPREIVDGARASAAIDGDDELAAIVARALAANADAAERMREGNAKAIGPIVGHVMRETKGRADGAEVARLVHEQLGI